MMRACVWLGGFALLAATAIDAGTVLFRNLGVPVHGTIELVQAAVLVAGSIALVVATVAGSHARVHLLVDRLGETARARVLRAAALLTAAFFAGVLAGSTWIASDLWNAHEIGEITGVPWRWMRLFANISLAAVIVVLLRQVFTRRQA